MIDILAACLNSSFSETVTKISASSLVSFISFVADISLLFVGIYTFRLTIWPKKLKVINLTHSSSRFYGQSLSVTIENRAISPITINEIRILKDENIITIYKGNLVLEGFKSEVIKMNPCTEIISYDMSEIAIIKPSGKKTIFYISTSRGTQRVSFSKRKSLTGYILRRRTNKLKYKSATIYSKTYNGQVVSKNIIYALSFEDRGGNLNTVFIDKFGFMSDAPLGYNGLPSDIVNDDMRLREFFDKEFSKSGLKYSLERIDEPIGSDA